MQLTIITLAVAFIMFCQELKAQVNNKILSTDVKTDTLNFTEVVVHTYEKPDWKKIDINFLSSYYTQDGNNSPVTGGEGTEQLTDFTQKVIFKVPTSPKLSLNIDGGYDYYSSASTDNIDNIRSSDSASDMRVHGNIGLSYDMTERQNVGFRVGGSSEYDYVSINGGVNYNWLSKNQNTSLSLNAQAFIDKWDVIYPQELRGQGRLVETDKRQSYNGSILVAQILSKRMQFSAQVEATYMTGLLSTPFHRVYFQDLNDAKVERLPSSRLKIPLGFRLNAHITDHLISRMYYRYYWDDWGIKAHTLGIELPIKLNRFFSIYPGFRYNVQTAADYFLPYKEHTTASEFYTSDYDIAAHNSKTYGIGLSYAPPSGLAKMRIPFTNSGIIIIEGVDLKFSKYKRSTGLNASIVSVGVRIGVF